MKEIRKKIRQTLENDVYLEVVAVQKEHIQKDVYDKYNPIDYVRRGENGGLLDENNIKKYLNTRSLSIIIVNETPPNDDPNSYSTPEAVTTNKNLPELVEYGNNYKGYKYDFPNKGAFMKDRPFTTNTIEELKLTKSHIEAMRKGLILRGINAESTI